MRALHPRESHPAADRRRQLQLSLLSHHARLGRNDAARRSAPIRQGDWHRCRAVSKLPGSCPPGLLAGQRTALRTPQQTAAWFATVARQVLDDVAAAAAAGAQQRKGTGETRVSNHHDRSENPRAHLAQYHAARMQAAVWYNVYLQSEDEFALDQCLAAESNAIAAWKRIIAAAGDVYPETLKFGVHRVGFSWHWKEELAKAGRWVRKVKRTTPPDATGHRDAQRLARSGSNRRPGRRCRSTSSGPRRRRPARIWSSPRRLTVRPSWNGFGCGTGI